jgi:hypothetical protein
MPAPRGPGILPGASKQKLLPIPHPAHRVLVLKRELEPQMDADRHRFSRSYSIRNAHPTDETRNPRKSFIISVHLRPFASLFRTECSAICLRPSPLRSGSLRSVAVSNLFLVPHPQKVDMFATIFLNRRKRRMPNGGIEEHPFDRKHLAISAKKAGASARSSSVPSVTSCSNKLMLRQSPFGSGSAGLGLNASHRRFRWLTNIPRS